MRNGCYPQSTLARFSQGECADAALLRRSTDGIAYDGGGAWGNTEMIVAPLIAFSLVLTTATGPTMEPSRMALQMSTQQKSAAMQPLVRSATECIARAVAADPRFPVQAKVNDFGDLIVASMPSCLGPVRAMIDAYDRYFGEGSGEAFFTGPYLDVLPTAVSKWSKQLDR
jgi:hypothetical protein